ncbi:MAG: FkbM family methyltransferase [Chitinophagaceae bacterium]|nr:FkbM family methyltransferase [Chitinophagaceae bacterium]
MFEKAIRSSKSGWGIKNKLKLLALAAYTSRSGSRWLTGPFIEAQYIEGQMKLKLKIPSKSNDSIEVLVRREHFESDYQSLSELVLFNCYKMPVAFQPDIIIDGGGNTGLFTILANKFYPDIPILLFEPLVSNMRIIEEHLKINGGKCVPYNGIITNSEGELPFYVRHANTSSFDPKDPYTEVLFVKSFSLQERLKEYSFNKVLIKLDIEGAEVEVIPELLSNLKSKQLFIVGELHHHKMYLQDLKKTVSAYNYKLVTFDADDVCLLFYIYRE